MDKETIEAIEIILKKGDKVELQPAKNGVIINRIRREKVAFVEKDKGPAK